MTDMQIAIIMIFVCLGCVFVFLLADRQSNRNTLNINHKFSKFDLTRIGELKEQGKLGAEFEKCSYREIELVKEFFLHKRRFIRTFFLTFGIGIIGLFFKAFLAYNNTDNKWYVYLLTGLMFIGIGIVVVSQGDYEIGKNINKIDTSGYYVKTVVVKYQMVYPAASRSSAPTREYSVAELQTDGTIRYYVLREVVNSKKNDQANEILLANMIVSNKYDRKFFIIDILVQ